MHINTNRKVDHIVISISEHFFAEPIELLGDVPHLLPLHGHDPILYILPTAALAEVTHNREDLLSSSIHHLDGWHKEGPGQAQGAQLCPKAVDCHCLLCTLTAANTAEAVWPATWGTHQVPVYVENLVLL